MLLKYNLWIQNDIIITRLKRLINQTYKLLPSREEGIDWKTPLDTIIEEFSGMYNLIEDFQETLFILLCKLEGLKTLTKEEDFPVYRRTIFECLSLIQELVNELCQEQKI